MADNLMSNKVMIQSNCINVAIALNAINDAAHNDNNKIPTQTNAAHNAHKIINDKYVRNVIYCSQNVNGMPDG